MELEADFVFQQDREGVIACCYDVAAAIAAPGSTASRMDGDPSRERKTTRQNSLGGGRPSSFGMHHLLLPHLYDYARGASALKRRSSPQAGPISGQVFCDAVGEVLLARILMCHRRPAHDGTLWPPPDGGTGPLAD